MNRTTNAFVVAACSVVIGWAGIATYNYFQTQHRQYVLEKCQKDEKYSSANKQYKYGISLGPGVAGATEYWAKTAKEYLNECLSKNGLQLKDDAQ